MSYKRERKGINEQSSLCICYWQFGLVHAIRVIGQFLSNPRKENWAAVKWILRYLRGTSRVCLCFGSDEPILDEYTYSDMTGDVDSRKSTTGFSMTFAGGVVSWQSKL